MLLQMTNKKHNHNMALNIYFYLTQKNFAEDADLRFILQKYHLNFQRLRGKGNHLFNNEFFFSKNINFIAQKATFLSPEDFANMMHIFVSKSMVVACIYNKQVLTSSRLKKKKIDSQLTIFENFFYQHVCVYF